MKTLGIYRISSFLFFSTLISCTEDFIDLSSPAALSPSLFYKNESQVKDALTGIYSGLRSFYSSDPYTIVSELPSDNTQTIPGNETFVGNMDKLSWTPTTTQFSVVWNNAYSIIAGCNILLSQIDHVEFVKPETKTRYTGEAKFLRALMYFNLVRFFGDVPLVLKKVETEEEAYTYGRTEKTLIYEQIEKDLSEAETGLPLSYTGADIGRVARGAAAALHGKVLLEQQKWTAAAAKLKELIDSKTYTLLPVYADVFDAAKNNNAEIVFAVQFTGGTNAEGSNFFIDFLPGVSGTSIISSGGAAGDRHLGTIDLFNAFEAGDARKTTAIRSFTSGITTYYYTNKFYETTPRNEGNQDWPLIRFSDVLLMYAEALNESGQTSAALLSADQSGPVNLVRKRAQLPELPATLGVAGLRLALEKERRVELCFEGHRWFDLVRTGRFLTVMKEFKIKYDVTTMQVDDNSIFKGLFPLPFREIQLNPALKQNTGYN